MTRRGHKGAYWVLAMFGFSIWVLVTRVCSVVMILCTLEPVRFSVCMLYFNKNNHK